MTWELISATPSPYARKVRIALQEKNLPFTLKTEVPWDHTTQTPEYNPLEKLPVLIFNDGRPAIYESHFILEWLETKYPEPSLLPSMQDADDRLLVKQIEVVVDGICDALVLAFFEKQRDEDKQSKPWTDRCVTLLAPTATTRFRLTPHQPNAQSRRRTPCTRHLGGAEERRLPSPKPAHVRRHCRRQRTRLHERTMAASQLERTIPSHGEILQSSGRAAEFRQHQAFAAEVYGSRCVMM